MLFVFWYNECMSKSIDNLAELFKKVFVEVACIMVDDCELAVIYLVDLPGLTNDGMCLLQVICCMMCEEILLVRGIVDVLVLNCCYHDMGIYVCYLL